MILIWILVVVTAQLRVVDAARAGARAVARGESVAESAAMAEQVAPPGAEALVTRTGDEVRVEVRVVVRPPGGMPVLPSISVDAVAYAAAEDAVGSDSGSGSGVLPAVGVPTGWTAGPPAWGDDP